MEVVHEIENTPKGSNDAPLEPVLIADCGEVEKPEDAPTDSDDDEEDD